jgi:hypothetical protein
MNFFQRFTRFVRLLDDKERYQFFAALLGAILLVLGLFFYRYYHAIHVQQRLVVRVQQQRIESEHILARYDIVLQQQQKVDALLQADPNFKIKQMFISTLQSLALLPKLSKDPEVHSGYLVEGYNEMKIEAVLHGLTMQELVTLLHTIEQNERVYIKEVKVQTSDGARDTLDSTVVIATFEATTAQE